ncbi:MAG TPA: MCE family protein [Acidimicrobiales bacterium]|nr:MCE family protein [Acidimicrobiales bacterium]
MRRGLRALVAAVVVAVAAVGAVVAVRAANGDYSGAYALTGYFPRAGEGLQPGSEVVFRGVQVGRVSTISLSGTRAKVTLLVQPDFRVPAAARATIEPVNLFGAEQVSLTSPHDNADAGPYLSPGATLAHAATSDELGDLFAAATPLLDRVNTVNLADVIGELAQAAAGEGPRIARSIDAGAHLATYLDDTLAAQLRALDSFARFTAAIAGDGTAINGLSAQENVALPAFNQAAADYRSLLANLDSFSAELARLLTDYHPDIAALLANGDNVARVLTAQQAEVGQVVRGAYQYAEKIGRGGSRDTLPDGSKFAYFNTFILFTDVNTLVCDLLAPAQPGLSFLEPVQQALVGAASPFNCSSQLAAFAAAQATTAQATAAPATTAPVAPATTPAATPSTSPTGAATRAAQTLATQAYGLLGRPSTSTPRSVGGYVQSLLGGA